MRPERKAPENQGAYLRLRAGGGTSMRPERKAPENRSATGGGTPTTRHFNEAGAKSPGEPPAAARPGASGSDFNEAGAKSPGELAETIVASRSGVALQ